MAVKSKKSSSALAAAAQAPSGKREVIFHDEFLPEFRAFGAHLKKLAKAKKESP